MTDVSDILPHFNPHAFVESGHIEIYDGLSVSLRIDDTCSISRIGRASQTPTVGKHFKVEYEGSATATCTVTSVILLLEKSSENKDEIMVCLCNNLFILFNYRPPADATFDNDC